LELRRHPRRKAVLYASDPAYLDAVLAEEKGWREIAVPPMSLVVFRREDLAAYSVEPPSSSSPRRKRARSHGRHPNEPDRTLVAEPNGMLRLFVYGTLKRGFWNHDRFCRGVLTVEYAVVRGRLFEASSGIPVLEVPEEDILAVGPPIHSPTWPHKRT